MAEEEAAEAALVSARPHPLRSRTFLVRALSALVLLPVAVFIVYLGGWFFCALVVAAGFLILREWRRMTGAGGPRWLLAVEGGVLALASILLEVGNVSAMFLAAAGGLGLVAALAKLAGSRAGWRVLGLLYVLAPALSALWLREVPETGFALCVWALALVWATDIGAYLVGASFGGPKLWPAVSPKKTWSGLVGGMALAAGVSVLLGLALDLELGAIWLALMGAVLALLAQAGDILESAIKRHFDVKDSGSLIPGHGGVMDRVDGLVFVMPVVAAGVRFL